MFYFPSVENLCSCHLRKWEWKDSNLLGLLATDLQSVAVLQLCGTPLLHFKKFNHDVAASAYGRPKSDIKHIEIHFA